MKSKNFGFAQQGLAYVLVSAKSDQSLHCVLNGCLKALAFFNGSVKTDRTGRMPKLIRVFVRRKAQIIGFVTQLLFACWCHLLITAEEIRCVFDDI